MPKIKAVILDCAATLIKPGGNSTYEIIKTLSGLPVPYFFITQNGNDTSKLQRFGTNAKIFEKQPDETKHSIFSGVVQYTNIKHNECLVIEDNLDGTKTASEMNMKVLAYLGENIRFADYASLRNAGAWGLLDDMDWLLFLTTKDKWYKNLLLRNFLFNRANSRQNFL